RIVALVFEVSRQASEEGKLFGSVTAQDIVDFLGTRGVKVERRRAQLDEPIKALGETAVPIRFHPEGPAHLRGNVVRPERVAPPGARRLGIPSTHLPQNVHRAGSRLHRMSTPMSTERDVSTIFIDECRGQVQGSLRMPYAEAHR